MKIIKRIFDDSGNNWELGYSYFGKSSKLVNILIKSEGGNCPVFIFYFDDMSRIDMYALKVIFVEYV